MDTVYGTKKYFQSLSGASDIYRSSGCRVVPTDYNYQNTIGRRSTLGAYYHMNKQPSYTNEHSISSQYGYNSWGMWRDGRNIAPSTFSTKTQNHYQKTKSFSIILTTAAFIVLLAVISIAGLAFYFSTIKAHMDDPVLGFEGSFRIAKGDLFSTGLKYNHTTTYKQKIEYYKRFVERALTDNALQPIRTDIWGFGEGPLIKVFFRTFLDVRKLPQNIHSVEEYIKESLFVETTALKSLYRSLRIDPESVEIKRILDEQIVKSASLFKEAQSVPTSQTQLEKRLMKKGGNPPPLLSKTQTTTIPARSTSRPHSADDEPEVDVENAPVIQGSFEGSFEITKTDADIARKKAPPTKAYSNLPSKAVTPYSLRVKPKKPSIEKLTTIIPQQQATKQLVTTTPAVSSTSSTSTTTTTTTTSTTTTTTTPRPTTTPTTPETTTTESTTSTTTTTSTPAPVPTTTFPPFSYAAITTQSNALLVPKLDTNLFTSVPILDTQPWRPIHREVPELLPGPPPAIPTKMLPTSAMPVPPVIPLTSVETPLVQDVAQHRIDEMELPFLPDAPLVPPVPPAQMASPFDPYANNFYGNPMRKPIASEETIDGNDMLFYHSFGNPAYMPAADGIERLGAGAHVQPHPLPVPLLDDVVIPPFKPLNPTLGTNDKLPFSIEAGDEKFEHLGGGVIVKKHDSSENSTSEKPTTPISTVGTVTSKPESLKVDVYDIASTTDKSKPETIQRIGGETTSNSELADSIGNFFMDLLNLPKVEANSTKNVVDSTEVTEGGTVESRIEPENEEEVKTEATEEAVQQEKPSVLGAEDEDLKKPQLQTQTTKPNFLNIKEIILKRKQAAAAAANQTRNVESATESTEMPQLTTTPQTSTTKRTRIRPTYNKTPSILDDSILFPSHSKWEFVNSSSTNNFGHTGNMRRVFNKTLQAWVSEDIEKTENFTLNDIKTRINNATNIQDISLIFDTLASKLGITPSVPLGKLPPFSQNKMKQTHKNDTRPKSTATTIVSSTAGTTSETPFPASTTTSTSTTEDESSTTSTLPPATTKHFVELPLLQQPDVPFLPPPMSAFIEDTSSEGIGAVIPVVGEAEVEVIDPNKYEEMLKSSQFAEASTTETSQKLVTLLPVRSNSGIRGYRPLGESQRSGDASTGIINTRAGIQRKGSIGQSRRFPPAEAIVKGGIKVTVK